ncbi:MAG: hypothetical protein ABIG64_09350 [Candidatus Omnitrophota bacterium]
MNNLVGKTSELKEVSPEQWKKLASKKIYFGHQSVGFNIISGLEDILERIPNMGLMIKETKQNNDFSNPVFAHSKIGKNKDPISKLDDFKAIMDSGVGAQVDIAFFKFCFVDVIEDTDINQVFQHYCQTFEYLENKYPQTTFIHFTVPLMTKNTGIKANILRLIGKKIWGDADNKKRNEFNALLQNKYGKNINFFNLAKFQATAKGQAELKSDEYYLLKEYTDDGGHLNGKGRVRIAKKLLLLLIDIE